MKTSIVVARSVNGVIGKGSRIPWRVKGEQKLFKDITMGGVLIMGRKTFESIGRPLPGRETIVISRNPDYRPDGCATAPGLEAALAMAARMDRPVYIVGGGEIYRDALPLVDGVHITTICDTIEGDVFFPDFPTDDFHLVTEERYDSNINYVYRYYERNDSI
jgi:dihydrofolate reductase